MKLAKDDIDHALDDVQVSLFAGLGEFHSASAINLFMCHEGFSLQLSKDAYTWEQT